MHDFRRTCAHQAWKAGSSIEDCKALTGHLSTSMFIRYADLFSEEERRERQRGVQDKRRVYRETELAKAQPTTGLTQVQ
jgi:hypothetical protein